MELNDKVTFYSQEWTITGFKERSPVSDYQRKYMNTEEWNMVTLDNGKIKCTVCLWELQEGLNASQLTTKYKVGDTVSCNGYDFFIIGLIPYNPDDYFPVKRTPDNNLYQTRTIEGKHKNFWQWEIDEIKGEK